MKERLGVVEATRTRQNENVNRENIQTECWRECFRIHSDNKKVTPAPRTYGGAPQRRPRAAGRTRGSFFHLLAA